MHRSVRRLLVACCALATIPVVAGGAPAGAIDQDLVVSATSGAPGTIVELSSASCPPIEDQDAFVERYLRALLISGTGDAQVMAGAGSGPGTARFIVPDWVDPDQPAVIEAACITDDYSGWDDPVLTQEPYDPVAFDVLAGGGAPTQSRTFSRTELLTGQAFSVSGTGCSPGSDDYAGVDLVAGADLSGRTSTDFVAGGGSEIDGGSFDARVDLTEQSWGVGWTFDGGRPSDIQVDEGHTDIPDGAYSAFTYCTVDGNDDLYLVLEPQQIDVVGQAPISDMDFTVAPGTRDATLSGASCTSGDVVGEIGGDDLVVESTQFDRIRRSLDAPVRSPLGLRRPEAPTTASGRSVGHEEWVPFTAAPDASGSWAHPESADFEVGVLAGLATCGDPLADGFTYDVRLAVVDVSSDTTTTAPSTTVPPSTAPPAGAVPGTPTYAG